MSVGKKIFKDFPKENWGNLKVSEVCWKQKEKGEPPLLEELQKWWKMGILICRGNFPSIWRSKPGNA